MDNTGFKKFITFSFDEGAFYAPFDVVLAATHPILIDSARTFRENLDAVISTVFLPHGLAVQFLSKFQEAIGEVTLEQLSETVAGSTVFEPASELLRQGTSLTWTALEVLCNDVFITLVNEFPELCQTLMEDEKIKKRFQIKSIDLETLGEFGYNVSQKMGTIFSQKQPIDSAAIVRDVFGALAPNADILRGMLEKNRFWLLNQRRNLILHRRAIVDETYRSNTGDEAAAGSRLEIDVSDIQTDLELVRDIGAELLRVFPATLGIVVS